MKTAEKYQRSPAFARLRPAGPNVQRPKCGQVHETFEKLLFLPTRGLISYWNAARELRLDVDGKRYLILPAESRFAR